MVATHCVNLAADTIYHTHSFRISNQITQKTGADRAVGPSISLTIVASLSPPIVLCFLFLPLFLASWIPPQQSMLILLVNDDDDERRKWVSRKYYNFSERQRIVKKPGRSRVRICFLLLLWCIMCCPVTFCDPQSLSCLLLWVKSFSCIVWIEVFEVEVFLF